MLKACLRLENLGLVPRKCSTGGKAWLGKTLTMGQRYICELLGLGAKVVHRAVDRFDALNNSWLTRLLTRRQCTIAATALARKIARTLWVKLTEQEDYRNPEGGGELCASCL
jgi:transposase